MVGSVQYVSDIARPKQQNVRVDTLWHVARKGYGRGIANPIKWLVNVEDRWCQHLQSFVT